MSGRADRILVILVHGTWASNAPWARPGAPLRTGLAEALQEGGARSVRFARVIWSGANADADRSAASERLDRRIALVRARHPDHSVFVVGHSHGGNVALRTLLRSPARRADVAGVATLATPFLRFREVRSLAGTVATTLIGLRIGLIMLAPPAALAVLATYLLGQFGGWFIRLKLAMLHAGMILPVAACSLVASASSCESGIASILATLGMVGLCALAAAILVAAFSTAREQARIGRAEAAAAVGELLYLQPEADLADVPLLVLSAPVDEALQVIDGAAWAHRRAAWAFRTWAAATLAGTAAAALCAAWLALRRQEVALAGSSPSIDEILSSTRLWFVALPLLGGAVVVGALLRAVLRTAAPLHGAAAGEINLYWSVHASRFPFEGRNVRMISYPLLSLLRQGRVALIHSRLYGYAPAIPDLAAWMLETTGRAAARRADPPPARPARRF